MRVSESGSLYQRLQQKSGDVQVGFCDGCLTGGGDMSLGSKDKGCGS